MSEVKDDAARALELAEFDGLVVLVRREANAGMLAMRLRRGGQLTLDEMYEAAETLRRIAATYPHMADMAARCLELADELRELSMATNPGEGR